MPPRRRAPAGSSSRNDMSGGATLLSLPDSLLIDILLHVHAYDRHEYVAPVCKRLLALTRSPELLVQCSIDMEGSVASMLPRLRSMLPFLCRHGRHIRQLYLYVEPPPDLQPSDAEVRELEALVTGCLVAVGAAGGQLQSLVVSKPTPIVSTAWLPALAALTRLQLGSFEHVLQLPAGFSSLACLREAYILGSQLSLPADGLPSSLTTLRLTGASVADLSGVQASLSRLTKLCKLHLRNTTGSDAGLEALCSLASLSYLGLHSTPLPACLPSLRQLAALDIDDCRQEDSAALDAALAQLTQLHMLSIRCQALTSVPPGISALTRLQRLQLLCGDEEAAPLPPGPWLPSLRWLGMHWLDMLPAAADGTLAQMTQLEYVCVMGNPIDDVVADGPAWDALWALLASFPSLRCLGLEMDSDKETIVPLALLDAIINLKQRRPALQLRRPDEGDAPSFLQEMLADGPIPAGSW